MIKSVNAYAKLNLTLDVTSEREDGYHELDTIMLRVGLCDTLDVAPSHQTNVSYKNIPTPDNDIVRRAVEAYADGTRRKANIEVYKRIPAQAGLGGGSADAAAVLRAMQAHYNALTEKELFNVALSLGADVPFCMQTRICRAKGIGELLEPIPAKVELWFLIVKPKEGISTKALFDTLKMPLKTKPDTDMAVDALSRGNKQALGMLLHNTLEPYAIELLPEIGMLHERLLSHNALGACMSGSGSSVIGLFENREAAFNASQYFYDFAFYTVTSCLIAQ